MRIFWKKNCKICRSVGGFAPEPRLPPKAGGSASRLPHYCYSSLLLQLCRVCY